MSPITAVTATTASIAKAITAPSATPSSVLQAQADLARARTLRPQYELAGTILGVVAGVAGAVVLYRAAKQ